MNTALHILNILGPTCLLVLLGAVLCRRGFAPESFFRELSRFVYWVGLPALLFHKTAEAGVESAASWRISLVLGLGMFACLAVAALLLTVLKLPRLGVGVFLQGAFRGNLAYVGLPIVLFALPGPDGRPSAQVEATALLAIAPIVALYNLLSVFVLIAANPGRTNGHGRLRTAAWSILTNPLIIACLSGWAYSATGWPLPLLLGRSLGALGQMALPLSLLAVGAGLRWRAIHGPVLRAVVVGSLIKVAIAPLAGLLFAAGLGLSTEATRISLIYLATPTAVASYVLTQQLGGDEDLAAGIIVLSTLLAMPAMAIILALA